MYLFSLMQFFLDVGKMPSRWVDDLIESHRKANFPCLFRYVKKNRIEKAAEVLSRSAPNLSCL